MVARGRTVAPEGMGRQWRTPMKKAPQAGLCTGDGPCVQCTPCIFFFIQPLSIISTKPAAMGIRVKIMKKVDIE